MTRGDFFPIFLQIIFTSTKVFSLIELNLHIKDTDFVQVQGITDESADNDLVSLIFALSILRYPGQPEIFSTLFTKNINHYLKEHVF